jgi:prepilin-type N-terminal cleavage/methylation domain-containing protein
VFKEQACGTHAAVSPPVDSVHKRRGFTLIELLLTVAIIGILAAIIVLAINPQKQLEDAHDARRLTDLNAILNAVHQFQIDKGHLPLLLEEVAIPQGEDNRLDICVSVAPFDCFGKSYMAEIIEYNYLTEIPEDPSDIDPNGSGYEIWLNDDGRVCVRAPNYGNGEGQTFCR